MKRYFPMLVLMLAVFFAGNVLAADSTTAPAAPTPVVKKHTKNTVKPKNKKKTAPVAIPTPAPAPEKK